MGLVLPNLKYKHERYFMQQPAFEGIRDKMCNCKETTSDAHMGICKKDGGPYRLHNIIVRYVVVMCDDAGIDVEMEKNNVLGFDSNKRPGDLMVKAKLGKDPLKEWCCDITIVQHNRGRDANSDSSRRAAGTVGTAMKKAEQRKMSANDAKIQKLCDKRIGFLPIVFERNGQISKRTGNFLNNIAQVGVCRKGHNATYFKKYWDR